MLVTFPGAPKALKNTGLAHIPPLDRGGPGLSVHLPAQQSSHSHCNSISISLPLLLPVTDGTSMATAETPLAWEQGMDSGLCSLTP